MSTARVVNFFAGRRGSRGALRSARRQLAQDLHERQLVLESSTSYGGITNISEGRIVVTAGASLGSAANGTVVTSGGSLFIDNATVSENVSVQGTGSINTAALAGDSAVLSGNVLLTGDTKLAGENFTISGTISGKGDDILSAGTTIYDTNEAALNAILVEWSKPGATYANYVARKNRLTAATSTFANKLNDAAVNIDPEVDKLTGSQGFDLFFSQKKEITDLAGGAIKEFFFNF